MLFHFPLGGVAEAFSRISAADIRRAGRLIALRRAEQELDNSYYAANVAKAHVEHLQDLLVAEKRKYNAMMTQHIRRERQWVQFFARNRAQPLPRSVYIKEA
jgi:hypothetical protein